MKNRMMYNNVMTIERRCTAHEKDVARVKVESSRSPRREAAAWLAIAYTFKVKRQKTAHAISVKAKSTIAAASRISPIDRLDSSMSIS